MQLFIIRHATAIPQSDPLDDAERPLTSDGRRRFKRAVRGLDRLGVRFDRLYHSPWLRAVETANELQDLVEGESTVTEHLAGPPTPALLSTLEGERVAVVGHQPWLGDLAAWLVFGHVERGASFELKKGGVVWLEGELEPGKMVLHGLLPPKVLRAARD